MVVAVRSVAGWEVQAVVRLDKMATLAGMARKGAGVGGRQAAVPAETVTLATVRGQLARVETAARVVSYDLLGASTFGNSLLVI